MPKKINKLSVEWRIPNRKKPIAYSTTATSDLITMLYKDYGDLRKVYENINYDEDAKAICKIYIDKGIYNVNLR